MGLKPRSEAGQSAQALFEQGCALVPVWGEDDVEKAARAFRLLGQAAELGHAGAAARLGELLWYVDGQQRRAFELMVRAARSGDIDAMSSIHTACSDETWAAREVVDRADAGDGWANYVLAVIHTSSLAAGFPVELPEPDGQDAAALAHFEIAADAGIARACGAIAEIHEDAGALDLAAPWAERGGNQGHVESWKRLASIEQARGNPGGERRAWEQAANLGDAEAKYALATILESEVGSEERALQLLVEAAEHGVAEACRDLAKRHEKGRGKS